MAAQRGLKIESIVLNAGMLKYPNVSIPLLLQPVVETETIPQRATEM